MVVRAKAPPVDDRGANDRSRDFYVGVSPPLTAWGDGVFCTGCGVRVKTPHVVAIGHTRARCCPDCLEKLLYSANIALNGGEYI